jgi:hypothetical protein
MVPLDQYMQAKVAVCPQGEQRPGVKHASELL